jgi:hypothetical protein
MTPLNRNILIAAAVVIALVLIYMYGGFGTPPAPTQK